MLVVGDVQEGSRRVKCLRGYYNYGLECKDTAATTGRNIEKVFGTHTHTHATWDVLVIFNKA